MNLAERIEAPPVPSPDDTATLAEIFRLMGDPSRLRIVLTCLQGEVAVNDIANSLGLSQSSVSHHLRLLRSARVLRAERRGKQVFYSAADHHVQSMLEDMVEHIAEPKGEGR
jgi:ArsR family transcriptional regulator, lead/cadmium/zinc/bismuth-responsive transcriptional repressor